MQPIGRLHPAMVINYSWLTVWGWGVLSQSVLVKLLILSLISYQLEY